MRCTSSVSTLLHANKSKDWCEMCKKISHRGSTYALNLNVRVKFTIMVYPAKETNAIRGGGGGGGGGGGDDDDDDEREK